MLVRNDVTAELKLLTIGYEGTVVTDFIKTLESENVTTLIDVREVPISRKKGFSKNALKDAVESVGIKYIHSKQLGDPKPGREAARSGNLKKFRRIFDNHIKKDATQTAIQEILPIVRSERACLLCFERCHKQCHRTIVANEISKFERIEVIHISVGITP